MSSIAVPTKDGWLLLVDHVMSPAEMHRLSNAIDATSTENWVIIPDCRLADSKDFERIRDGISKLAIPKE